jgi:hypothetical protein
MIINMEDDEAELLVFDVVLGPGEFDGLELRLRNSLSVNARLKMRKSLIEPANSSPLARPFDPIRKDVDEDDEIENAAGIEAKLFPSI